MLLLIVMRKESDPISKTINFLLLVEYGWGVANLGDQWTPPRWKLWLTWILVCRYNIILRDTIYNFTFLIFIFLTIWPKNAYFLEWGQKQLALNQRYLCRLTLNLISKYTGMVWICINIIKSLLVVFLFILSKMHFTVVLTSPRLIN